MPGPPPPPPPSGMPPPPPPLSAPIPIFKSDDRSALLKSIQKGTKLKKAVTVDKSAPLIGAGKISNNNTLSPPSGGSTPSSGPPNGLNLGGLFAGGMPKLKPTGKLGAPAPPTSHSNSNNVNNNDRPVLAPQQMKNSTSLQNELKKQMANDNRNRGPPPPAPVRNSPEENGSRLLPTKAPSTNGLHSNHSSLHSNSYLHTQNQPVLHRKVKSNVSLSSLDSHDSVNGVNQSNKPVISHGKPNLAPKPPVLNAKPQTPPKKLTINGKPVSRAHSMKSPRSPSPQSPDSNVQLKFGTVRNLSSVIGQSLANSTGNLSPRTRPMLNGRPNAPPPSVPSQQPPPPPPHATKTTNFVKPPNHAPPPPPNHTPPPPPHRTPSRPPPAVPNNYAPPPPPRHSSMTTNRKAGLDLDDKYKNMFHDPSTFPKPPPYRNVFKFYGSRQAGSKQQAPQPPNFQSTAKTWDASSAC